MAREGGVDRLNARVALEGAAWALRIGMKLTIECFVDFLRLVQSWVGCVLRVFDACSGLFEHVVEAGAGPWTHVEKDGVDVAQTIEAKDCGIDPAVDRNIRGIKRRGLTDRHWAAAVWGGLSRAFGCCGRLGCEWMAG